MKKIIPLITFLLLLLFTACRESNFNQNEFPEAKVEKELFRFNKDKENVSMYAREGDTVKAAEDTISTEKDPPKDRDNWRIGN